MTNDPKNPKNKDRKRKDDRRKGDDGSMPGPEVRYNQKPEVDKPDNMFVPQKD